MDRLDMLCIFAGSHLIDSFLITRGGLDLIVASTNSHEHVSIASWEACICWSDITVNLEWYHIWVHCVKPHLVGYHPIWLRSDRSRTRLMVANSSQGSWFGYMWRIRVNDNQDEYGRWLERKRQHNHDNAKTYRGVGRVVHENIGGYYVR